MAIEHNLICYLGLYSSAQNYFDFETGEVCLLHKAGKDMT